MLFWWFPPVGWSGALWRHRELLWKLSRREIEARYRGSVLGWVSKLRERVDAGLMKDRTFNRRIAAISSI